MAGRKEGSNAPEIKRADDRGATFRLSALRGKNVVVYFYPKADTPGCTKEACGFRDELPEIEKANTVVVGISPDPVMAIAKFKEEHRLNFTLLADEEHKAAQAYGVWVEKSMYGKTYMGVARTTFIVTRDGTIAKVFVKVKPEGHADEVRAALEAL